MGNIITSGEDVHPDCPVQNPKRRNEIKIIYIVAIVIWLILIYVLNLYNTDLWGWLILLIPIVIFVINFSVIDRCSVEVDPGSRLDSFLSYAFIIVIFVINWDKNNNNSSFFTVLILGLILTMLSLLDVWVTKDRLQFSFHIRGIFQTLGLILITYSLYVYYLNEKKNNYVQHANANV